MERETLNRHLLDESDRARLDAALRAPVTVLQVGEGNFLRGFFDWMIDECRRQGLFAGSIAVTQPRPSGKAKIEALARQDGAYTLVVRGLEDGRAVERKQVVAVFSQTFDPYADWERLVRLAESPDLRFLVSNTTEAGLVYMPEPLTDGPIRSFPGKVAYLLYRRYVALGGTPDSGLVLLPCELLERNGDALREAVLLHVEDRGFPAAFREWVVGSNRFLNSLVDRIVTGYPDAEQAEAWFADWGYADAMLNTAEPYHLWAIEGEPSLDDILPLRKAGLSVHWTDDLKPYQQRKVRILNGAHTWMAPLGLLHGVSYVRELMADPRFGPAVRETVLREIVPTLPYPAAEMAAYAETVFERFANPYIRHRLADIAMNSLSKFRVRLLPSLAHYADRSGEVPAGLAEGLAGLLRYYRVRRGADGSFYGTDLAGREYDVRDDALLLEALAAQWAEAGNTGEALRVTVRRLLADERLWGRDLSAWPELADAVSARMAEWEAGGR